MRSYITITINLILIIVCGTAAWGQVRPSSSNQGEANPAWYLLSKKNIFNKMKISSSKQIIHRISMPNGGALEIGTGLTESPANEKINRSEQTTDGKIVCNSVNKSIDLTLVPDYNVIDLSVQSSVFPGLIFDTKSFLEQSLRTPTGLPARKPMTIVCDAPSAKVSTFVLTNPGILQMDLLTSFVQQNHGMNFPAEADKSIREVNSSFEFAAAIEAHKGVFLPLEEFGVPAEVNAGAGFSGSVDGKKKVKSYFLRFFQPMYVLRFNEFNSENIFQSSSPASYGNLALINSVTYGRMAFVRIESEENILTVKAALKAKLGVEFNESGIKVGSGVEGTGSVSASSTLKSVHIVFRGGNSRFANKASADLNDLKRFIDDPSAATLGPTTGAVPITFTMVRLSDFSALGIHSAATFDALQDCREQTGYSVYIKNFGVKKVVDNPLTGNDEDLFGSIKVEAFYKKDGKDVKVEDETGRSSTVWSADDSDPVQLKEGKYHYLYQTDGPEKRGKRRFVFTPEQEKTGFIVIRFRFKDKIMNDGEQIGNSHTFMKYEEKEYVYPIKDWKDMRDEQGCTDTVKEIGGDSKLCINFSMYKD